MPKKKQPAEDPKKQFDRFIETAREHGVDESGEPIADQFKKLAAKKHRAVPAKKTDQR